jgi:hypothetical protein
MIIENERGTQNAHENTKQLLDLISINGMQSWLLQMQIEQCRHYFHCTLELSPSYRKIHNLLC